MFSAIKLLILCMFCCKFVLGKKTSIQVDVFDHCRCAKDCILSKFDSTLRHYKDSTYIDSTFELSETVKTMKISILPMRCNVKEALDTCEKERHLNINEACAFLLLPNTMWSNFVHAYKPSFTCPFKKGVYIGKNGSLEAKIDLPMSNAYYRIEADFYSADKNKYLWTFCVGLQSSVTQ